MLKACKYCGRIHDSKYDCGHKPKRNYSHDTKSTSRSAAEKFRSSSAWRRKAEAIKRRDHYLCQAALHGIGVDIGRLISEGLEVHHIVPIEENYELRLMDTNLITLTSIHHKQAEEGAIPREVLADIARANTKALQDL